TGLGNLVRCSRTARRRLRGELLESLAHCIRAFRAGGSRAHRIDADAAGAIFSCPRFRQQIEGGLARLENSWTRMYRSRALNSLEDTHHARSNFICPGLRLAHDDAGRRPGQLREKGLCYRDGEPQLESV